MTEILILSGLFGLLIMAYYIDEAHNKIEVLKYKIKTLENKLNIHTKTFS